MRPLPTTHAADEFITHGDINDIAEAVNGTVPLADAGMTLDTSTYDNTVAGSGKLTTIVVPADTTVLAIAVSGDAHPRFILNADPTDFGSICLGDGTFDPASSGCAIGYNPPGDLFLFARTGRATVVGDLAVTKIRTSAASATTPGSVVKKIEVFDSSGTSIGFLPVYSTIT